MKWFAGLRWSVVLTLLPLAACAPEIHRDYAFTQIKTEFPWGKVQALLHGTDTAVDQTTSERKSPYRMLFWISFAKSTTGVELTECAVTLSHLRLTDPRSGTVWFAAPEGRNFTTKSYPDSMDVTFVFSNLSLDYHDYDLEADIAFGESCGVVSPVSIRGRFGKAYKEKTISFWDKLMGI